MSEANNSAPKGETEVAAPTSAAPQSALRLATRHWMQGPSAQAPVPTPPTNLNSQAWQAVQSTNAETAAYAATQIAVAPNMMITQASGLVAQSAAAYFDGISKLGLATQSVLLKQMAENVSSGDMKGAANDAMGALLTDLLVSAAAAVAASAGTIDADAASTAMTTIHQSLSSAKSLAAG